MARFPERSFRERIVAAAIVAALLAPAAMAFGTRSASGAEGTGLPLPRFVSLRATEANLRTGPGVQYPVDWVYHRQLLPFEIVAEYHTWRKVRDWEGTQGWVHQSMLDGARAIIITGSTRTLRRSMNTRSDAVARAEPGVIGRIVECPDGASWCKVEIDGFEGWLRRVEFWGVYADEVLR